jgi:hypothetical protein
MLVAVGVGVPVTVAVGVTVAVLVGVGVRAGVCVAAGVAVGVLAPLVLVGCGVRVIVGVPAVVGVAVTVAVWVTVGVGVTVGCGVWVGSGVLSGGPAPPYLFVRRKDAWVAAITSLPTNGVTVLISASIRHTTGFSSRRRSQVSPALGHPCPARAPGRRVGCSNAVPSVMRLTRSPGRRNAASATTGVSPEPMANG